ncbi:caspase family protein [Emticicia sp. 17c]|uniref:caspase family protein n=1 Tax=Emticicia sp. 17c TaxID=3127704 RepID=UPI00301C8AC9
MNLRLFIIIQLLLVQVSYAQSVYSVALIGTDDKTRLKDAEQFTLLSKDIATNLGFSLKTSQLTGVKFNAKNTKQTLQNINPNPSDIVILYYSGKGTIDEQKIWPVFHYPESDLLMRDAIAILKAKKPKLLLIIGDCDQKEYIPDIDLKSLVVVHPASEKDNFAQLFTAFKGRTTILISSTSVGQVAKRDKTYGSVFLKEFKRTFEEETSSETSNASWNTIREKTLNRVQKATNNLQKPKFTIQVLSDVEDE